MIQNRSVDISIIVLNYRTPEQTAHNLQCFTDMPNGIDIEKIVVDNASSDDSLDIIKEQCPGVRLIEMPENRGFSAGMNAGIRVSSGSYMLLLNSDVEVDPDSLCKLYEFMRDNPEIGLAAPLLVDRDGHPGRSVLVQPTLSGVFIPLLGKLRSKRWKNRMGTESLDVEATEGAAVLVQRETIEKAGMLDEDFFFYHEIVEWCLRIRDNGYRTVLYPAVKVLHIGGASTDRIWLPSRIELKRSEYQLLEKRMGKLICRYAIVHDFISSALRCFVYGCLGSAGDRRAKIKYSFYKAVLLWLAMRMPCRNNPRYISNFGKWD